MSSVNKPGMAALVAAYATIYIVWGSTYLAMRVGIESIQPLTMAGVRFLCAGSLLWATLRLRGHPRGTARQWRDNAVVGTILLLGGNGLVIWAEQHVSSGIAALLISFSPMSMVLIEWAFPGGRRPGPWTTLGLLMGFGGIVILMSPFETREPSGDMALCGSLAVVGSTVFWAFGSILLRHVRNPAPTFTASAMQMLCGGAALTLAAGLRGEFAQLAPAAITMRSWAALAYLIFVGSLIAYSTYTWLITHSPPERVSTYAYVNPIVAVFLGWLILDEPISSRTLLAAAIIIAAVILIIVRKNKRAVQAVQNARAAVDARAAAARPNDAPAPADEKP